MQNFEDVFGCWCRVATYRMQIVRINGGFLKGGMDINVESINGQRVAYVTSKRNVPTLKSVYPLATIAVNLGKNNSVVNRQDMQVVRNFDEFFKYLMSKCSIDQLRTSYSCNFSYGGGSSDERFTARYTSII